MSRLLTYGILNQTTPPPIPSPDSISGLQFWWDFTDSSNRTDNGTTISAVVDKAGSRNGTAGGNGGANILLGTNASGVDYADFTSSADNWMSFSSEWTFSSGQFTIVVFMKNQQGSTFGITYGGNNVGNYYRALYGFWRAQTTIYSVGTFANNYSGVMLLQRDGSDNIHTFNGSTGLTPIATSATVNPRLRSIGRFNSTTNTSPVGQVYGWCIYNKELTTGEKNILVDYFNNVLEP